ncbi:MAG: hypothetical protein FJ297_04660 [Planctomycetes bacterium]|nr:hypothetical protein [Planctomycetota bacterium]
MAKTAIASSAELIELLEKSRLLEDQAFDQARRVAEAEPDAGAAARKLVDLGVLSPWQADQLLAGQFSLRLGDSKFLLYDEVGEWEFGRSFLAADGTTGEQVGLKLLSSRIAADKAVQKSLLSDLGKVSKIRNRGFVNLREVGRAGPRFFLVLDSHPARTVAGAKAALGGLGNAAAIRLLERAAGALGELHRRGLEHACLTPARIGYSSEGAVLISDAGLRCLIPALRRDPAARDAIAEWAPPETSPPGSDPARRDWYSLARIVGSARAADSIGNSTSLAEDEGGAAADAWRESIDSPEADQRLDAILARMMDDASSQSGAFGESRGGIDADLGELASAESVVAACRVWRERYLGDSEPLVAAADDSIVASIADSAAFPAVRADTPSKTDRDAATVRERAVRSAAPASGGDSETRGVVIETRRKKEKKETAAPTKEKKKGKADRATREPSEAQAWLAARRRKRARTLFVSAATMLILIPLLITAYVMRDAWRPNRETDAERAVAKLTAARRFADQADKADAPLPDVGAPLPEPPPDSAPKDAAPAVSPLENARSAVAGSPGAELSGTQPKGGQSTASDLGPAPEPQSPANGSPVSAPAPDSVAAKTPDPAPGPATSNDSATAAPTVNTPPSVPPAGSAFLSQLPESLTLPKRKPETDATGPDALGAIPVDDQAACMIELVGGDRVSSKANASIVLENAEGGTAPRKWDVFSVAGPGSRKPVGRFALLGGQFTFEWLDAARDDELAGMLENCFLRLRVGAESRQVGLRRTIRVPALVLNLDRGATAGKWEIPNGPDPAACRFEVLSLEGPFPPHVLDPSGSIEADGGKQWVYLGANAPERVIVLRVESGLRRTLAVNVTCLMSEGQEANEEWMKDRNRRPTKANRTQLIKRVDAILAQAKAKRDSFAVVNEASLSRADKEQFLQQRNLAQLDFDNAQTARKRLDQVEKLSQSLNDRGKVHFRVVFEAEGRSIELLRSE